MTELGPPAGLLHPGVVLHTCPFPDEPGFPSFRMAAHHGAVWRCACRRTYVLRVRTMRGSGWKSCWQQLPLPLALVYGWWLRRG